MSNENVTKTTTHANPQISLLAAQVMTVAQAIELDARHDGGTASLDWAAVLINVGEQLHQIDRDADSNGEAK